MIRIEHVEKSYGKRPVLKDVSLEVPTGSVTVTVSYTHLTLPTTERV